MSSKSTTSDIDPAQEQAESGPRILNMLRVVVGLFDHPTSLIATLQELTPLGFAASNFCVLGSLDTVRLAESILQKKHDIDSRLVGLFVHTEPFYTAADSHAVCGSYGNLLPQLRRVEIMDLKSHVEQGLLVLAIKANEPRQMVHASKVLLRRSPHDIQTHEFLDV